MSKRVRQYIGLFTAILAYYLIHEGAHLVYALSVGAFKQINFMGLGIQIDIFPDSMSQSQLGVFCLVGSVATFVAAYILIALTGIISRSHSKVLKTCAYYTTLALLLLDPLYLSVLCGFFGGGDMNGIGYLIPVVYARIAYGILLIVNAFVFWKFVLPKYRMMFSDESERNI